LPFLIFGKNLDEVVWDGLIQLEADDNQLIKAKRNQQEIITLKF